MDCVPEGGCKGAVEHDVCSCLLAAVADLTNSIGQDMPTLQMFPALNPLLNKEPSKELHPRRRPVAPNEGGKWVLGVLG